MSPFYRLNCLKEHSGLMRDLEEYRVLQRRVILAHLHRLEQRLPPTLAGEQVSPAYLERILASAPLPEQFYRSSDLCEKALGEEGPRSLAYSLAIYDPRIKIEDMEPPHLSQRFATLGERITCNLAQCLRWIVDETGLDPDAGFERRHYVFSRSGDQLYPPGGFMGWHTNDNYPGYRLYMTHVEEPGRSFFRWRDPETQAVVTDPDTGWDFRLFAIRPETSLWHCVFTEVFRFSVGYYMDFSTIDLSSLPRLGRY